MQVLARSGKLETRSMSIGMGGSWNSALDLTGVVPPHGWDTLNAAGVPVTERTVAQIGAVDRCIDLITNYILAMGDPRSFRVAYDQDGLAYPQFVAPTPGVLLNTWGTDTQSTGVSRAVYSLVMFREAFLHVLTRDFYGFPSALEVLHPAFLVPDGSTGNYSYGLAGSQVPVAASELIHVTRRARPGIAKGASSMQAGSLVFALALAASQYGLSWFGQGAQPGFLLSTDQRVSPDEQQRILEKIIVDHSGLGTAHLPMILPSGLKAQMLQSDPADSQLTETLAYARDEVASFFGVPPAWVAGTDVRVGLGKTLAETVTWFLTGTLTGYIVPLQEAYSQLLPRGQFASLNTRRVTRANAADAAAEILALRTAGIDTKNEIRRDFYDLAPATDPEADQLEAPLNSNTSPLAGPAATAAVVQAAQAAQQASNPPDDEGDDSEDEEQ